MFKISEPMWSALLGLFFDYANRHQTLMVSLASNGTELWALVPEQQANSCSTTARLNRYGNLLTGEILEGYPPPGFHHAGGLYCQNEMPPFWSATTDASELTQPGIYLVLGNLDFKTKTYEVLASAVKNANRSPLPVEDVVQIEGIKPGPYSSKIQKLITSPKYTHKKDSWEPFSHLT